MNPIMRNLILAVVMVGGLLISTLILVVFMMGMAYLWIPIMFTGAEVGLLACLVMSKRRTGLFSDKR